MENDSFVFACKHCEQKLAADEDMVGLMIDCPNCKQQITVTRAAPAKPVNVRVVPSAMPANVAPMTDSTGPSGYNPAAYTPQSMPSVGGNEPPPFDTAPAQIDVSKHMQLAPGERLLKRYYARKRVPKFRVLLLILGLLLYIIPGLIYLLWYWLASRQHGIVVLTNRRVSYIEYGQGFMTRHWRCSHLDLFAISSVDCYTQHGIHRFLGLFTTKETKAFLLKLQSRDQAHLTIGGLVSVSSSLFEPADDSLAMVQEFGSRILELQRAGTGGG